VPMNNSYYYLAAFQTDNSLTAAHAVDIFVHLLQMLMVMQHQPPDDRTSTPVRVGSRVQEALRTIFSNKVNYSGGGGGPSRVPDALMIL
jgi:hypothetical protein